MSSSRPISFSRINSSLYFTNGNVGINTTVPASTVDISGTLKASGLSALTNVTATNVSTGVLIASTGVTTGTISASGTSTLQNVTANSVTSSTLIATTSVSSGLLSATNIIGTNISAGTLSGTTFTGGNLSLSGNLTVAGTLTTVNITSTNVLQTNVSAGTIASTNATTTNIVGTNISAGSVRSTGVVNLTSTTAIQTTTNNYSLTSGALNVSGDIILSGTELMFAQSGVSAPTMNGRNSGSKIVLYPETNVTQGDYSIGIESSHTWFQVPSHLGGYKFYQGTSANFVIATGGNVGINTGTPGYTLDVAGTGRFANGLTIATSQPGVYTNRTITSNTNIGMIHCADRPAAGNLASFAFSNSDATVGYISINTPSYKLEINGNCKVTNELYVGNAGGVGTIYMGGGASGDSDYNMSVIETRLFTGSEATEMLLFKGNDVAGASGPDRIRLRAGAIAFDTFTSPTSDRTAESIRMYINESGDVGIGTVSPAYKLEVSGAIYATGEISAFSDKRLKTDITTITNSLDKVKQLRGVYYTHTQTQKRGLGVIAQEIQEILPEVVATDGKYLGVAYGNIVGVLIEAVKELESENTQLKSQIQTILQHLNL